MRVPSGFGSRGSGSGFRVSGFGFRVSGAPDKLAHAVLDLVPDERPHLPQHAGSRLHGRGSREDCGRRSDAAVSGRQGARSVKVQRRGRQSREGAWVEGVHGPRITARLSWRITVEGQRALQVHSAQPTLDGVGFRVGTARGVKSSFTISSKLRYTLIRPGTRARPGC